MASTSMDWDENLSTAENARGGLAPLVEDWFTRGRELAAGDGSGRAFHSFRLRTKRLRYTLEMFRPFYGPRLDEYLAALRQVQTRLGELNDCAVTRKLLPAESPQRARVDQFLERRERALRTGFRKAWKEVDQPGEDARWMAYLGRSWKANRAAEAG